MVSALFILVVLAVLGGAMSTISQRQQRASASELNAARAYQAARAGLEWGAFLVLMPAPPASPAVDAPPGCFASPTHIPLTGELSGFVASVTCTRSGPVVDGDLSRTFYSLQATACNVPTVGSCASTPASPTSTYVERRLNWTVSR